MAELAIAERWGELRERGWLRADAFESRTAELAAVRAVATDGLGAGRIFDGHRNGLERLLVAEDDGIDTRTRSLLAAGELAVGVWGADPGPDDGLAATLDRTSQSITGVKVFSSGAGLLDLAIVLVRRTHDGPPTLPVLVDLGAPGAVHVDEAWFRAPALRESHSHRVVFDAAPVVGFLGEEGSFTADPWISGDALRSAAVWAGAADTLLARMRSIAGRPGDGERLGRAAAICTGADAWLAAGAVAVDAAHAGDRASAWPVIAALRLELTERLRELMRLAAEHVGSRGLATDDVLREARDGLDLLLLQHRLGPVAERLGAHAAEQAAAAR
ncbi:MAG: hypothetical protein J7513_17375 [Solirubrobacteraceae bacterium]|nr:hypothetical protein [Solirubrobacteraceae bacterium]